MHTNIAQLISEAVVALFNANGKLLEWGDAFTSPYGLTSARWQILGAIARAGQAQTAPQIGEQMGISRQGVQKQLNLLTADGLVEKHPNPAHQRSPLYQLSMSGQARFSQINQAWEAHASTLGDRFSTDALAGMLHTLRQLAAAHELDKGVDDEN